MKYVPIVFLIFVMYACSPNCPPAKSCEFDIEPFNFDEFIIDNALVSIGTAKHYYFEDEIPLLFIRNLPKKGYTIKVNGVRVLPNLDDEYNIKMSNKGLLGYRKNTVQILDSLGAEKLNHEVVVHKGRIKPYVTSEYGNYLFREIPSRITVSNIAMTCPHVILKSSQANLDNNADGSYTITPYQNEDTVKLTIQIMTRSLDYQFTVLDPPTPSFIFEENDTIKCIALLQNAMLKNLNYTMEEIHLIDHIMEKKVRLKNTNCYTNDKNIIVEKFIYSLENTSFTDTIFLN